MTVPKYGFFYNSFLRYVYVYVYADTYFFMYRIQLPKADATIVFEQIVLSREEAAKRLKQEQEGGGGALGDEEQQEKPPSCVLEGFTPEARASNLDTWVS